MLVTLASPLRFEAAHYRHIVSRMQGLKGKNMDHDPLCPGCEYDRRAKANPGAGARHGDSQVTCSECGHERYEEITHIVTDHKGRRFICPSCLAVMPASQA